MWKCHLWFFPPDNFWSPSPLNVRSRGPPRCSKAYNRPGAGSRVDRPPGQDPAPSDAAYWDGYWECLDKTGQDPLLSPIVSAISEEKRRRREEFFENADSLMSDALAELAARLRATRLYVVNLLARITRPTRGYEASRLRATYDKLRGRAMYYAVLPLYRGPLGYVLQLRDREDINVSLLSKLGKRLPRFEKRYICSRKAKVLRVQVFFAEVWISRWDMLCQTPWYNVLSGIVGQEGAEEARARAAHFWTPKEGNETANRATRRGRRTGQGDEDGEEGNETAGGTRTPGVVGGGRGAPKNVVGERGTSAAPLLNKGGAASFQRPAIARGASSGPPPREKLGRAPQPDSCVSAAAALKWLGNICGKRCGSCVAVTRCETRTPAPNVVEQQPNVVGEGRGAPNIVGPRPNGTIAVPLLNKKGSAPYSQRAVSRTAALRTDGFARDASSGSLARLAMLEVNQSRKELSLERVAPLPDGCFAAKALKRLLLCGRGLGIVVVDAKEAWKDFRTRCRNRGREQLHRVWGPDYAHRVCGFDSVLLSDLSSLVQICGLASVRLPDLVPLASGVWIRWTSDELSLACRRIQIHSKTTLEVLECWGRMKELLTSHLLFVQDTRILHSVCPFHMRQTISHIILSSRSFGHVGSAVLVLV